MTILLWVVEVGSTGSRPCVSGWWCSLAKWNHWLSAVGVVAGSASTADPSLGRVGCGTWGVVAVLVVRVGTLLGPEGIHVVCCLGVEGS